MKNYALSPHSQSKSMDWSFDARRDEFLFELLGHFSLRLKRQTCILNQVLWLNMMWSCVNSSWNTWGNFMMMWSKCCCVMKIDHKFCWYVVLKIHEASYVLVRYLKILIWTDPAFVPIFSDPPGMGTTGCGHKREVYFLSVNNVCTHSMESADRKFCMY